MAFSQLFPSTSSAPAAASTSSWADKLTGTGASIAQGDIKINGLAFDYAGEVKAELSADVTEHYMEDNSFVQDHVALRPKRVTMKGIIGELVAGPQLSGVPGFLQSLQSGLTTLPAYLGGYAPEQATKLAKTVTQVQKISSQLTAVYSTGKNILSLFKNSAPSPTRQGQIYAALEAYFEQRVPFTIVTPFRVYNNMVIEALIAVQPEDTKFLSEFTITLKEIRKASVTVVDPNAPAVAIGVEKNEQQKSAVKNQGRNYTEAKAYNPADAAAGFRRAGI